MEKHLVLFLVCSSIFFGNAYAQQPLSATQQAARSSQNGIVKTYYPKDRVYEAPRALEFAEQTVTYNDLQANFHETLTIPETFTFTETESSLDNIGMRHHFWQQNYQDIPIEGLGYRIHERNGYITAVNGKAVTKISLEGVSTSISERDAFKIAVEHLQTNDTIFRTGEKLIVSKDYTYSPGSFAVAYQFDIDVSLIERWRISVDAQSGQIINQESLVKSCLGPPPPQYGNGTGLTNYYGTKTIKVDLNDNGSSTLNGQSANGGRFGVRDFGNKNPLLLAFFPNETHGPIISSSNNNYISVRQQAAVSVQWAVEQTFEYYFTEHNRNSFNNGGKYINSYVHVGDDYDNAFWTGKLLAFGDGSNNNPPVELDVVSHEFTHGVTQYEAALIYRNESGALNESFSDIFSKAVEFNTLGDEASWQMAVHFRPGGIRDLSYPNHKSQPDTYRGDYWYNGYEDNGGVHINSGVQNFWFYLLCEGGSGINDKEVSYSIDPIGMDTTVNIAYRNLNEYLISTSDYLDCRIGSLLATADLYGKDSKAYEEVDKAWDAVGVIDEPIITGLNIFDITATTVKLNGSLLPRGATVSYHFEYGTTTAYGSSTLAKEYNGTVEDTITGLQSETKYYIRLVAINENGSSFASREFTTISLAPLVNIKHTVDVTDSSAILYGRVNPNSRATSFYFAYGSTSAMELSTPSFPLPDTTEYLDVSAHVTGLLSRETYFYKLVATNDFASSATDSVSFFTALKPVVSSFTPVVAMVGEEITITGMRFNPIADQNIVWFGSSRGTVLSGSTSELKVEVPQGASFGPVIVLDTESGLSAESVIEFVPTYSGDFDRGGYQLRATYNDFTVSKSNVNQLAVRDMDGDGRPDIVASHIDGITIFQNINTGEDISNESFIPANIPINVSFYFLSLVDLDGNGLSDVVGYNQEGLRIYPNFSVPGYIYFGVPVDVPIGNWRNYQFKDFDDDGHIDFACTGYISADSSLLAVFRNLNPKGVLSDDGFALRHEQVLPHRYFRFMTTEDINNDGKPDLLASEYNTDFFSIIVNNSQPGVFDFQESFIQDTISGRYSNYVAQDLNHDGWKDITAYSHYDTDKIVVFDNRGQDISQLKPVIAADGNILRSIQPGDVNGDGKVDLLVGDYDGRFIFLKNNTENGLAITDSSLVLFEHYGINENKDEVESQVILTDLNGDGRPEVINNLRYSFYPYKGNQIEIWQNTPNDCLDPSLITVSVKRNGATIHLPANTTIEDFEIEYASINSTNWRRLNTLSLSNLPAGASYKLRARATCYLGFTGYHFIEFTTECVALETFQISDVQIDQVTYEASGLSDFEVQYSVGGEDIWVTAGRFDNQITGLLPGTLYDLRYRGRCYTPTEFNYLQFTTLCPTIGTITIKELTYNSATVSAPDHYAGEPIFEYSEDSISWDILDSSNTLNGLIPGKKYFVRGKLGCTNIHSEYIYTSFITPCPRVSALTVQSITPFSANLVWQDESETDSYVITYATIDGPARTVETNARSVLIHDLSPGTTYLVTVAPICINTLNVNTRFFNTECYTPFNVNVHDITYTSASLSWESNYSGAPYLVDYSITGSNDWTTKETTTTDLVLNDLRPGTSYDIRVHIHCESVTEPFVSTKMETSLYEETVVAPNPTENIITIYPSKNLIGNPFMIYDDTGRKVADGLLQGYSFDFSTFPSGTYIIKIDGEHTMKIIRK